MTEIGYKDKNGEADFARWIVRRGAYVERSIQVVLGGMITVLTGFLSQVWGIAQKELLLELSYDIAVCSTVFSLAMLTPGFRLLLEEIVDSSPELLPRANRFWFWINLIFIFTILGLLARFSHTIIEAASPATP